MNNVDQTQITEQRLRHACTELARRFHAGEDCSAQTLLECDAELAENADAAVELIYTEFALFEERGEPVAHEEWYRRFPKWRDRLERLFELHTAMRSAEQDPNGSLPLQAAPGGYEILEELGRGGMGVVFKARQRRLDRIVAVKMLLAGELAGSDEWARITAEARAAAQLQHPNIVQIFEVGEWNLPESKSSVPFIAMEYVPGGTLADRLSEGPMPARTAAAVVETLARTIHFAHQQGIVHRDLKPANVLLAGNKQYDLESTPHLSPVTTQLPKITDFGLAKDLDASVAQTRTAAIVGTPSYMAPEQAGPSKLVGPAADIYALGTILYECLTARPPFRGETALDTLDQVRSLEPVPPGRLQPSVPRDLQTICLKCLRKEPSRRFPSAVELADDLGRYLAGKPIRARPIGAAERLGKWARRRPALATVLTALAILIVASFVTITCLWQRTHTALSDQRVARLAEQEEARRREAQLYETLLALAERDWINLDRAHARQRLADCPLMLRDARWHKLRRQVEAERDWTIATAIPQLLALSADGRRAVTAVANSPTILGVFDAETGAELARSPAVWSQEEIGQVQLDGDRVVSIVQPRPRLIRSPNHPWPVPSGGIRAEIWMPGAGQSRVSIRAPGKTQGTLVASHQQLVALADGNQLQILNLEGGEPAILPPVDAQKRAWVRFSSGGRFIAAGSADRNRIIVWDVTAQKVRHSAAGETGVFAWGNFALGPDGASLFIGERDATLGRSVLRLVDLSTGNERWRFSFMSESIGCMALSSDGKRLATGDSNKIIRIRDAATGNEELLLRGHTGNVLKLAFDASGERLISSGADNVVRAWNIGR